MTQKQVAEVAAQHQVSVDTVRTLMESLQRSGGHSVQFNISELGGMGQWMSGMTMAGGMSDYELKGRVDALCSELSKQVISETLVSDDAIQTKETEMSKPANWWPEEFGEPGALGGQNGSRYAYFAAKDRFVVEQEGEITAYDTSGYKVFGAGQQQSSDSASLTVNTDRGSVELKDFPIAK